MSSVYIRVQDPKHKVDVRQATKIQIERRIWETSRDSKNFRDFYKNPLIKKVFDDTDAIRNIIDQRIEDGNIVTKEDVRSIIRDVIYRDEREAAEAAAQEEKRKQEEANRMTLMKYIDNFMDDIQSGARQTEKGTNYTPSSIRTIKTTLKQFKTFCSIQKHEYDFEDINMQFYHEYTAFLKQEIKDKRNRVLKQAYSVNTIGKAILFLKTILSFAESEGYNTGKVWKDKHFKGTRMDVDSIYLPREDLNAIMKADLTEFGAGHEQARDIFMVGCWTAQRISDYNNITKEQIDVHTKRWIEDVPDPENPGQTMPVIKTKEIMFIKIRQQKTGALISIPVSSELRSILEKYDYKLPHLADQVLNRYLKDICKAAGLTEEIEVVETVGGTPKRVRKQKWELVHSHTARRTGATLMYLSGMDIYDIMKITGHTTPAMLRKYIKADQLDVLEKITDKYDYFD